MTRLEDEWFPEPINAETADDDTLAAWMLSKIYTVATDLDFALNLDRDRSQRIWAMAIQTFNAGQDEEFCDLLNATDVDAVFKKLDELQGDLAVASLNEVSNAEH